MSTPSPLDSLKPIAGRALEVALNRLLALDPETTAALAGLEGKRVELTLDAPPLALALTVRAQRLRVGPVDAAAEPDLGMRATLGGLIGQLPFMRGAGPAVGKMRINGDAELARTLQQLAKNFDPDWDKPFADALGPLLGPQVGRLVRDAMRAGSHLAQGLARDTAEYVTEESRDVVAKAELEAFHDDVDALRDRADRLIARVSRISDAFGDRG